jgi:malonyl CoA-acyl carrier protein transacylase
VDCMERLFERGCEFFIELGPGTVLAGLLQRMRKSVDVMSVGDPESARKCVDKITTSK